MINEMGSINQRFQADAPFQPSLSGRAVVHPFKAPVVAIRGKPAVNRLPWRQVVRQQGHGQPARMTRRCRLRSRASATGVGARRAGLRQMRRDRLPLRFGQIGLLLGDGAAMLLSSGRRPHGESQLVQETPWNHRRRR
jgi:hypothetical protein